MENYLNKNWHSPHTQNRLTRNSSGQGRRFVIEMGQRRRKICQTREAELKRATWWLLSSGLIFFVFGGVSNYCWRVALKSMSSRTKKRFFTNINYYYFLSIKLEWGWVRVVIKGMIYKCRWNKKIFWLKEDWKKRICFKFNWKASYFVRNPLRWRKIWGKNLHKGFVYRKCHF